VTFDLIGAYLPTSTVFHSSSDGHPQATKISGYHGNRLELGLRSMRGSSRPRGANSLVPDYLSCLGVSTRPQSRTLAPREEDHGAPLGQE
jgi:hypothetical protein